MNIRALFFVAAVSGMSLMAACASGPQARADIKYEPVRRLAYFGSTRSTEVGAPVDVENLVPAFSEATPTKDRVKVEMQLVEISREIAADVFGMSTGTEVFTVAGNDMPELIRSMTTAKDLSTISAPQLVCQDQQRANISILAEEAYIAAYEIKDRKGLLIADPVVKTFGGGLLFSVLPRCTKAGVELEIALASSQPIKPTLQREVELPNGATGKIDLPVTNVQKVETKATVEDGSTLMINAMNTDDGRVVVLIVKASKFEAAQPEGK